MFLNSDHALFSSLNLSFPTWTWSIWEKNVSSPIIADDNHFCNQIIKSSTMIPSSETTHLLIDTHTHTNTQVYLSVVHAHE